MFKKYSVIFLFLLFNCSKKQPDYSVTIGDLGFVPYPYFENTFICKAKEEYFDTGFAKLIVTNDNLELINSKNDGYTSIQIKIIIDRKLKVKNLKYSYSTDVVVSGEKNIYKVEDAQIKFTVNPFKNKTEPLIVYYKLTIKQTTTPPEFWRFRYSDKFIFEGITICK